jgi:hypothetical protein
MPVTGHVRQPRAWLNCGGGNINLLRAVVYQTRGFVVSEFTADMALDDATNPGASFWSCTAPINASLIATNGDGSSGTVSLINGKIDRVNIDWDQRIVSVHGRDRAGELLDQKMQEGLPNKTYAQVLEEIAKNHNLTLHLNGGGGMAGKTFNFQEYQFQADNENEMDVVHDLAERLGMHVHIFGNDMYVEPPGTTDGGTYAIAYTPPTPLSYAVGNFIKLRTQADVAIAEGGSSSAASHHTNSKESFTSKETFLGGEGTEFYSYRPGLLQDQVQNLATRQMQEVETFAKTVEVNAPGDVNVNPRMQLALSGTQSCFDQSYFIDTVTHYFDLETGYRMTVEAKNIPDSGGGGQ